MPSRIFGPKKEVRGRRELHNEELCNLYSSPDAILIESREIYRGRSPLGRLENNIKML
jgi:hypothetical protein